MEIPIPCSPCTIATLIKCDATLIPDRTLQEWWTKVPEKEAGTKLANLEPLCVSSPLKTAVKGYKFKFEDILIGCQGI